MLTSHLATFHFAPTETARQNLLREGIPDKAIAVTGNTAIDTLFLAIRKVKATAPTIPGLPEFLQPGNGGNRTWPRLVLITGHRREMPLCLHTLYHE